ncbi:FhaA domain-containing protein [Georgenia sp. Z1491]|uniref:FhaA domain-containing protein n=1 Tax=Georgenia sp. Z1491 TaxID=3416707 RepID=UPI003CEDF093
MGILDRFEKGVENVVSTVFSKAFRSEVKPVEIASAVRREMDERAATLTRDRTVAPNEFHVELAPNDLARVQEWGHDALAGEMTAAATAHATSQSYSFVGPVDIDFVVNDSLSTGRIQVRSATRRGAVAPAAAATASAAHPILDIDGRRYLLTGPTTVLGRGSESDIVLDDSGVSRRHLEITVSPQAVIATDLGTTNGTFVEGHRITAATLVDGNTITMGRSRIMFWTGEDEA